MIKFTTVNVDGLNINREFNSIDEMQADWNNPDGTTLPSLDDELVYAEINNKEFKGSTFDCLARALGLD